VLVECFIYLGDLPRSAPETNEITKSTKKIKNIIFAIPAAAPAMPPKPNTAAIKAITKNVIVQRNIVFSLVIKFAHNN